MSEEGRVEAPDRIWLDAEDCCRARLGSGSYYEIQPTTTSIEYVRAQPPTADAVAAAKEVVAQWKRDIGQAVKYKRMEADIAQAISAAEQRGRDEQREKDARLVEGYHENPSTNDYNIAAAIRSNQ